MLQVSRVILLERLSVLDDGKTDWPLGEIGNFSSVRISIRQAPGCDGLSGSFVIMGWAPCKSSYFLSLRLRTRRCGRGL